MKAPDTNLWAAAARLFDVCVELPLAARAPWLKQHAGADPELEAALLRLLAAHDRLATGADGAQPLVDHAQALLDRALRGWGDGTEVAAGTQIGPFRVLRALGEGGMGEVYLAERAIDDQQQQVALKLPRERVGVELLARFRRERAILANLDHPAIARLIDIGEVQDGRPYLVMEYVAGRPIVDYCDGERLDLAARLRLVIQMLGGLQHAHQRLVLHRDIKSANVLVDHRGQPRLLDFGIGKLLVADTPASTVDGQRFFSLASAAPEQITGAPTSAATDVYAVGVLLYELLTGVPPLALAGLSARAALDAAVERVPPLASAAFATLAPEQALAIARARHARPGAWVSALRGDIDQILARALRKEVSGRYPTADALAADLQAVLERRPIAARSNERWYRLRRFARRHALALALTTGLLVSAGTFMALILVQSQALRTARDAAERGREEAEQVTLFLKNLFRQADPLVARGSDLSARELLDRGNADLTRALTDQPLTKGQLLSVLADIWLSLNDYATAHRLAEQALTLRTGHAAQEAESHEQLARIELTLAHYDAALRHIAAAPGSLQVGPAATERDLRLYALRTAALAGQGAPAVESVAAWERLVAEYERRYGAADARTRGAKVRLALNLGQAGYTERERALISELNGSVGIESVDNDPAVADLVQRRALLARNEGRSDEAARLAQLGYRINLAIYGRVHTATASSIGLLATIEQLRGNLDESQRYFESALQINQQLLPAEHPKLAALRYNLGSFILWYRRDARAALPYLEAAVASDTKADRNLGHFRLSLGQALADLGQYPAARLQLQQALAAFEAQAAPRGRNAAKARGELACLRLREAVGDPDVLEALAQAIAHLRAEQVPEDELSRLLDCSRQFAPLSS